MVSQLGLQSTGKLGDVRLRERRKVFVRTGSFLLGYAKKKASYITDACANPADLGVVKLTVRLHRKNSNGVRVFEPEVSAEI